MRRRRSHPFVVATVLALTLAPLPGRAFDQPGCGGSWTGSRSCRFVYQGFPITVFGDTTTNGGDVRVWITPDGYPEVILLECDRPTRCDDELRAEGFLEDAPPPAVPRPAFRCYVEGQGQGLYFCGSGRRTGGGS